MPPSAERALGLPLKSKLLQQFFDTQTVMGCDALEDTRQSLRPYGIVIGDDLVVLTIDLSGYAHVRTALPRGPVAQAPKRSFQAGPA